MQLADQQFIQHLQTMLGLLECEFLYLVKDAEAQNRGEGALYDTPAAKLVLAAYCIERASRIVNEQDVVAFLNSKRGESFCGGLEPTVEAV